MGGGPGGGPPPKRLNFAWFRSPAPPAPPAEEAAVAVPGKQLSPELPTHPGKSGWPVEPPAEAEAAGQRQLAPAAGSTAG